ncbi:hypothetical protein C8R45DRAFT_1214277 [Mycena sanguinolenta]|nr:hypothetical protein C8R45DRAFT_1214277 [Mycena sanguinolenta]
MPRESSAQSMVDRSPRPAAHPVGDIKNTQASFHAGYDSDDEEIVLAVFGSGSSAKRLSPPSLSYPPSFRYAPRKGKLSLPLFGSFSQAQLPPRPRKPPPRLRTREINVTADTFAIIAWLDELFQARASYDKFLSCRGAAAQQLLDLLQDLLDYDSFSLSRRILLSALRLARTSGLHPRCFALPHLELFGDRVAGGGFSDVYRASVQGQSVAVKMIRAFNQTEIDAAVKSFGQEAVIWR